MTVAQLLHRALGFAARAVALQGGVDGVEKFLIAERLLQKAEGARLHRPHGHRHVGVAGDEDDGRTHAARLQFGLEIEPALAGQPDVEQHAMGGERRRVLQKGGHGAERAHVEIDRTQEARHRLADARVVVDEGDGLAGHAGASGSVN